MTKEERSDIVRLVADAQKDTERRIIDQIENLRRDTLELIQAKIAELDNKLRMRTH